MGLGGWLTCWNELQHCQAKGLGVMSDSVSETKEWILRARGQISVREDLILEVPHNLE